MIRNLARRIVRIVPAEIREPMLFELRALAGRKFSKGISVPAGAPAYLNLGCGTFCFDDYINVDMFLMPGQAKPHALFHGVDLRHPLPLPSSSMDGVFSEHTFEHMTFPQAARLFAECFRVLKPGARIRVSVPDLSLFIEAYCKSDGAWFAEWERLYFTESEDAERRARRLITPMTAISFVTQEYGHLSAWDFATMTAFLSAAGFAQIAKCDYRQGGDPRLLRDLDADDRRFVSLYAEAVKPLA
jgi:SAM-dependent methyltransferase